MRSLTLPLFACVLAVTTVVEAATIIYDNGIGGAANIDLATISELTHGQAADDFVLQFGAHDFDIVYWSGIYGGSDNQVAVEQFYIRVFGDDGYGPEVIPLVNLVQGTDFTVQKVYDPGEGYNYVAELSAPVHLMPMTTYWLSIVNDTDSDPDNWYWGALNGAGNDAGRYNDSFEWGLDSDDSTDFALALGGQMPFVPEPSTLALVAVGLMGLAGSQVRRRRRVNRC